MPELMLVYQFRESIELVMLLISFLGILFFFQFFRTWIWSTESVVSNIKLDQTHCID